MSKLSSILSNVTTVGLDLAKRVFYVHCINAQGDIIVAKALRRKDVPPFFKALPSCLVGLEACGSSHYWGRELIALGHDARLMPPAYVKPYVRRQKNDATDAAAICEAVTRPSMRFAEVRSVANQAVLMHHKTRSLLVRQRTQLLNSLRGHLSEIGIIAAQGPRNAQLLAQQIREGHIDIPEAVAQALLPLTQQLEYLETAINDLDKLIAKLAKSDAMAKRLMSIGRLLLPLWRRQSVTLTGSLVHESLRPF